MKVYAIILAAGSGSRMGLEEPKQFLKVHDKPLFMYALETFNAHPEVNKILLTTSKEHLDEVKEVVNSYSLSKLMDVSIGGDSRQESVSLSLERLKKLGVKDDDIVLIHDSARPLVSNDIISNNIKCCKEHDAVDTVIPASDTIIRSIDEKEIESIPLRKELYQGQTPQTFKYKLIKEVHDKAKVEHNYSVTDDCGLFIHYGYHVYLVKGNKRNFKVTTKEDLDFLKSILDKE